MWSDRVGIFLTAAIVVLLAGATVAVYAIDAGTDQASSATAIDGRAVFLTKGCTGCHSREGASNTAQIGPNLTGLTHRAGDRVEGLSAEEYVRQSILDPQAYMVEGYGPLMPVLPLDADELAALVEFLLSEA